MASSDEVLIRIRAAGGKAAAKDIEAARRELDRLGRTSQGAGSRAAGALGSIRSGAAGLGSSLASAAGGVAKFATAAGALSGAAMAVQAARTGSAYNQMQDSQMVAFSTMLKSEDKAKSLMKDIQRLAADSPVLDPGSTGQAVQQLLNYGMSVDKVLPLVKTLGDASAASGKAITEVMPQAALALGQIEGKGKLSAEELNQLTEAVGINRKLLAKELDMTSEEFADAFKPGKGISAENAIPAIQRALQAGSKGAAEKLSKTTAGQVDLLKETMSRELGKLTRPWYDAAGRTAGGIADVLNRKDLSGGQKVKLSFDIAKEQFGPLIQNAKQAFKEAKVGQELAAGIERYVPQMINALANGMVTGAPKVAGAFLRGFTSMGPWGQALTVAFLLKKFGAFGPAGRLIGRLFGSTIGRTAAPLAATGTARGIGKSGKFRTAGLSAGRLFGAAFGPAAIALFAPEIIAAARGISQRLGTESKDVTLLDGTVVDAMGQYKSTKRLKDGDSFGEGDLRTLAAMMRRDGKSEAEIAAQMNDYRRRGSYRGRATGGTVRAGETTLLGENGPEVGVLPAGMRIKPASSALSKRASRPARTGTQAVGAPGQGGGGHPLMAHFYFDRKEFLRQMTTAREVQVLAT